MTEHHDEKNTLVMRLRRILLAAYFTCLSGAFLWVPWQRRIGENWKNVGYSALWGAPKSLPSVAITRIDLAQLGIELCALTALLAALLVLITAFAAKPEPAAGFQRRTPSDAMPQ